MNTVCSKQLNNQELLRELRECLKEAICIKCAYCRDFYRNCPTICDLNKKDCNIIAKWRKSLASNVDDEL